MDLGACTLRPAAHTIHVFFFAGWQLADTRLVNETGGDTVSVVRSRGGAANNTDNIVRGRLDIWSGRFWGTISNATFGQKEAVVACRTLGFKDASKALVYKGRDTGYGYTSLTGGGAQLIRQISCTGQEDKLRLCQITWCDEQCPVGGEVGIQCG